MLQIFILFFQAHVIWYGTEILQPLKKYKKIIDFVVPFKFQATHCVYIFTISKFDLILSKGIQNFWKPLHKS